MIKRERTSERRELSESIAGFIWAVKSGGEGEREHELIFLMHGQINKSSLRVPYKKL